MMTRTRAKRTLNPGLIALVAVWSLGLGTGDAKASEDWRDLYRDARPVLDIRYRLEFVDQDGLTNNATAHTVRTRAGVQTGRLYGIGVGFDVEWIEAIGAERFNDTVNGKSQYPVIADPDDTQINQLFIVSENTVPDTLLKLGRQRIVWDDSRFIGNVGFRQNEQTFDAFRGVVSAIPDTAVEYVYLQEVHRIFGTDSPVGNLTLNSHGLRVSYSGLDALTITPFALLLDYDATSQAGQDSQSYGILVGGSHDLDDKWKLLYAGSLAYQADYADSPSGFDLWYYRIEPGIAYGGIKLRAGYEVLEGDGTRAFQTPLATLHKFNGLTDKFLTTPANGLEDLYLSLDAPLPGEGLLSALTFKAGYHEFRAERGDSRYGSEWDAGIFKNIPVGFGSFNLGLQYASYNADEFSRDTDKLWLTLQFTLSSEPLRSYLGRDGR